MKRMIDREITQIELAGIIGYSVPLTRAVIFGDRTNPRGRAAIAEALGLKLGELWPQELERKVG